MPLNGLVKNPTDSPPDLYRASKRTEETLNIDRYLNKTWSIKRKTIFSVAGVC